MRGSRAARWALRLFWGTACLALVAVAAAYGLGFRLNLSPSAPAGIYRLGERPALPGRGRQVLLCLPPELAQFSKERGYSSPGGCPGHVRPLVKKIAALPGDLVDVTGEGIRINGRLLPGTAPLPADSLGRPLTFPLGPARPVPEDSFWVYSDHVPNSWDSRYYGALPLASVVAEIELVWRFDE